MDLANCPHCYADLRGELIPEEYLREGSYGPWDGSPQFYMRTISVEVRGVYDGGLFYQCPDCGKAWHRWTLATDKRLHETATWYINEQNRKVDRERVRQDN